MHVNAKLQSGNIVFKDWGNGVNVINHDTGLGSPGSILLPYDNNTNRVINYAGKIIKYTNEELIELREINKIAKC